MAYFNQFEATTRFNGKKSTESTAGTAKVPRVGVNRSDLEAQGEQQGWTVGPLTPGQVKEMSSAALRWHEEFNKTNLDAALALPAIGKHNDEAVKQWANKRLWEDQTQATPEQAAAILQALEKFKQTYPQFIPSRSENQVVLLWLKDRNMEVTFTNLVESFQANALAGKLWINPNAINAGSETEVSGQDLVRHHSFHLLLQPQKRMSEVDKLSAKQYFEAHKDVLADKRVPPLVAIRQERANATTAHWNQIEASTSKSGSTTVIDFPQQQNGVPAEPDNFSFKRKIRSMSATEFAQRCNDDPAFKAAVEKLDGE